MDYHHQIVTPAVKTTLPQPGIQRRWTALPVDALSGSAESDAGLADGGYGWSRSQTREDGRDGVAFNGPFIAAKQWKRHDTTENGQAAIQQERGTTSPTKSRK